MRLYDILIVWLEWSRNDYIQRSRWERGIPANKLTQADAVALSRHTNKICPAVSLGWPRWPEELS